MRVQWLARMVGAAMAAGAGLAAGCEVTTAPPANAMEVVALTSYPSWWHDVEQCSGLTGDLDLVTWYTVPADSDGGFWCQDGPDQTCAGEWVAPHAIFLAGPSKGYPAGYASDEWTVKHEMLHDLVGRPGHPAVFGACQLASRTPSGVFGLGRH